MKLKCQYCNAPIWPSGMAEIEIYSELECLKKLIEIVKNK